MDRLMLGGVSATNHECWLLLVDPCCRLVSKTDFNVLVEVDPVSLEASPPYTYTGVRRSKWWAFGATRAVIFLP